MRWAVTLAAIFAMVLTGLFTLGVYAVTAAWASIFKE